MVLPRLVPFLNVIKESQVCSPSIVLHYNCLFMGWFIVYLLKSRPMYIYFFSSTMTSNQYMALAQLTNIFLLDPQVAIECARNRMFRKIRSVLVHGLDHASHVFNIWLYKLQKYCQLLFCNFILFELSYTYIVFYQTKTKPDLSIVCVSTHMLPDKTNLPLHLAVVGIPRCT